MVKARTKIHHKKRHGRHQKRNKSFARVYMPYLPLVIVAIFSLFLSSFHPLKGTLAYATSMSRSNLLSATNNQRINNGMPELSLNQQLSDAAQAKANDMAARNYWSHNTPDGQEPWVFVDSTGYKYLKAGENLAYGFATSEHTVIGWMNSPSHKANLLDPDYKEVGFGYANSPSFNQSGPQTIVVAMYGTPQTLAASGTTAQDNVLPEPDEPEPAQLLDEAPLPVSTATTGAIRTEPKQISRIQALTGGYAPWALFVTGIIAASAAIFMLLRHSFALRHLLRNGEQFILHHPLLDTTLVSIVLLAVVLSQTVGIIL